MATPSREAVCILCRNAGHNGGIFHRTGQDLSAPGIIRQGEGKKRVVIKGPGQHTGSLWIGKEGAGWLFFGINVFWSGELQGNRI